MNWIIDKLNKHQGHVLLGTYIISLVLLFLNVRFDWFNVNISSIGKYFFLLMVLTYVFYLSRTVESYFKSWTSVKKPQNPPIQVLDTVLPMSTILFSIVALYGAWTKFTVALPLTLLDHFEFSSYRETEYRLVGWTVTGCIVFISLWTHLVRAQYQIHLLEKRNEQGVYEDPLIENVRTTVSLGQWYFLVILRVLVVFCMITLQLFIVEAWNEIPDLSALPRDFDSFKLVHDVYFLPLVWGSLLFFIMCIWDLVAIFNKKGESIDKRTVFFLCFHLLAFAITFASSFAFYLISEGSQIKMFKSDNALLLSLCLFMVYLAILLYPPKKN